MADGSVSAPPAKRFFPMPVIVEAVADAFGMPVDVLRGQRIAQSLLAARQVAALLMLEYSLASRIEIALALGHTEKGGAGYNFVRDGKRRLAKNDEVFGAALQQARERLLQGGHHV